MKFHFDRCIGIVAIGIAIFFLLALMVMYLRGVGYVPSDFFFLVANYEPFVSAFRGFIVSLVIGAIFLSLEVKD